MSVPNETAGAGSVWLTRLVDLPDATESSLRRSLLTPDGRGVQFKEACLNELLERERTEIHSGRESEERSN